MEDTLVLQYDDNDNDLPALLITRRDKDKNIKIVKAVINEEAKILYNFLIDQSQKHLSL